MPNVDTHVFVDFIQGKLSDNEHQLILSDSLMISDIVLWELSKLVQLRRLKMDLEDTRFRRLLAVIDIVPITLEIAQRSTQLDFRSDPADEIIAATSVVLRVPLLTRDKKILRSKMVPLVR